MSDDNVRAAAKRLRRLDSTQNMSTEDWEATYGAGGGFQHDVEDDKWTLARAYLADDWRPIDSAPKDGTWVILWTPAGVQCGYWGGTYFGQDPTWVQYAHRSDFEAVEGEPTHWRPLPPPPGGQP